MIPNRKLLRDQTFVSKQEGMPFNYNWEVNDAYSGNVFNHGSKSDGKVTEGEYRVLLPDGRTQVLYLSTVRFIIP